MKFKLPIIAMTSLVVISHPVVADVTANECDRFGGWNDTVEQVLVMEQEVTRHNLDVPRRFLEDLHDLQPGAEHKAQLFRVTREDFDPLTRRDSSELVRRGDYDFLSFLLHDPVSLDEVLDATITFHTPNAASGIRGFKEAPLDSFSEEASDFNLTALRPLTEYETFRDFFIARDSDGRLNTVISCYRESDVLLPGCNHDFRSHDIDVRVIYRRFNLTNWDRIQRDISDFVNCIKEN